MQHIVFDIEIAPEPDIVLERLFSFDESTVKNYRLLTSNFEPSEVKLGNMKDSAKIEARIEVARLKFTTDKAAVAENIETARSEAWQTFRDRAALSPLTGRVLAVGWWNPDTPDSDAATILEGNESVRYPASVMRDGGEDSLHAPPLDEIKTTAQKMRIHPE